MDRLETPAMRVNSLGIPFAVLPGLSLRLAVWPVRRQDFAAFADAAGHDATGGMLTIGHDGHDWLPHGHTWRDPGFAQADDHPVVGVNRADADAFCAWLTARERSLGLLDGPESYRLPSDGEWSVAAGLAEEPGSPERRHYHNPGVYPWGRDWPPPASFGNYAGAESAEGMPAWWGVVPGGYADPFPRTSPVGSFAANALGIYDLSGNVWEWCTDAYAPGGISGVARGGSWGSDRPAYLQSATRLVKFPDARTDEIGFRILLGGNALE